MANFYKSEVVAAMRDQALVPVFYHPDREMVLGIIGACVKGGSRLVEFTNRGEGAADLFGEVVKVCRKEYPGVMVGVGSIRDEITAGIYIGKGADFVVGPTFNPKVAEICNRLAVAYSPGCGSATEINNAEACGSEIIKVFPGGEVGGPEFFKSIHGPAARTQMMPTGGVDTTVESMYAWLVKGKATALGIGSNLISKSLIGKKDFDGMAANVRKAINIIRAIRTRMLADEGVIFLGVGCVGVGSDDAAKSMKLLGELAGFGASGCCIGGRKGAELRVGQEAHLAIEVTDLKKAIEILKSKGIEAEGELDLCCDENLKYIALAKGAFGLKMPVRLYSVYNAELEKFLNK